MHNGYNGYQFNNASLPDHSEMMCALEHYPSSVLIVSKHKPNGVYFHRGILLGQSQYLLIIIIQVYCPYGI
jgi:hypothetical protein